MICREAVSILILIAAGAFVGGMEYEKQKEPAWHQTDQDTSPDDPTLQCEEVPDLVWPVERPDGALENVSERNRIWLNRRDDQFKEALRERQDLLEEHCE